MPFVPDRRLFKVTMNHAQKRVAHPRVGVVARGWDFLNGTLDGMWVSPITGVLQSIPNSEEKEYQTENSDRWSKYDLSGITTIDQNTTTGTFAMTAAQGMHVNSAILYTGDNTAGVGAITNAALPKNTGVNLTQYVYGSGTDQDKILIEFGWSNDANYMTGESVRVYLDGKIKIYRNGVLQSVGAFSGGEYQFGTVSGGSYEKPSDQYVQIRAEATRDRYLLITSSLGGVFQFACPWAIDQYNPDGTLSQAAQPILSANKAWFRVPEGGCSVVWSSVRYAPSGTAVSEEFALSEPPGTGRSFSGRAIPGYDTGTAPTVTLVAPDGSSTFDVTTNRAKVKVAASTSPIFIDETSTRYDPTLTSTPDESVDVTDWVRSFSFQVEDGPEGATAVVEIAKSILRPETGAIDPCPVDNLEEVENRPIRIDLVPNPGDPDAPDSVYLLDGVGGPVEWTDGMRGIDGEAWAHDTVKIEVRDRLVLLQDAKVSEAVTFAGSYLCRKTDDCAISVCLRQGGITEYDLPDLDFKIDQTPSQKVGRYADDAKAGDSWYDVLKRLFDLAPSLVWNIRPQSGGPPLFKVIDPDDPPAPVGTLYRTADDAADDVSPDDEIGSSYAVYGDRDRSKLALEGNLVRVLGLDPATQKPIIAVRSDNDSRDPQGEKNATWLGCTRTVAFSSPTITTQQMADRVADSLKSAVTQRAYVDGFTSLMLFGSDGLPVWRGDRIMLDKANPDGSGSTVHITSLRVETFDESGAGLVSSSGPSAPIALRRCKYTAGALVGLGGATVKSIQKRHRNYLKEGGWKARGAENFPDISPSGGSIKGF
jgi:hypothetical protein